LKDLNEDRKIAICDALRSANLLNNDSARLLYEAILVTVDVWQAEQVDVQSFRKQHKFLKSTWCLIKDTDPPIGQIRSRFKSLPHASRYQIRRRAARLWPRVFKFNHDCDPFPYIEKMGPKQLLRRLPRLLAEGGLIKSGGSEEFEPTILGVTRGLDDGPVGGRPRGDDELRLITYLAFDWKFATGELPKRGRNTEQGFGELVRHVFSWTTKLKPEQALRRFWEIVPKETEEPPQAG
jgi:hypothetical protein